VSPALEVSLVFAVAWLLDASVGEPPAAIHPVVWIGKLAAPLTRAAPRAPWAELCWGALYVLVLAGGATALIWHVQRALVPWPALRCAFEVYVLFSCFALNGLLDAGRRVRRALLAGDVPAARVALGSLCSRDAATLSAPELSGAALESLSENSSDSVVAPLFYYALFGLPGAVCYRAVNTLDAMVGYRGRFEYLGKAAARLDDLLNFVPARLTAGLLWLTGALLGLSSGAARAVFWRDRNRTESPNAGQVMAMAAGLLGVRLDKRGAYVLGAELAAPDAGALASAIVLVRSACWLFAVLLLAALLHWGGAHGLGPH
jgi:adenosylcobinamide-phosphate synthase